MANHLAKPFDGHARTPLKVRACFALLCIAVMVLFFVQPVQKTVIATASQPVISAVPTPTFEVTSKATAAPTTLPAPEQPQPVAVAPVTPVAPVEPVTVHPIPLKAAPTWITIPDARISVDVSPLPMTEAQRRDRYWIPPNVPDAFWVDSYDQSGSGSTDLALIVAHACEGLSVCATIDWQFSRLSEAGLVKAGTEIFVTTHGGNVCYVADADPVTYEKDQLQKHAVDVWGKAPRPGKLVLISCYTRDIHEKNVVIIASMVSCGK